MMKFIENNSFEITLLISMLCVLKLVLLGYNMLGFYDFNNLFLK